MKQKSSKPEERPFVSLLALFLSIVCCLGFVHVEIKLQSQEDEIRFLAKEAMLHQKTHLHQQLPTQHLSSDHETFGFQWKYIPNENRLPKSEDESKSYDIERDRTHSERTIANGKQGRILFRNRRNVLDRRTTAKKQTVSKNVLSVQKLPQF